MRVVDVFVAVALATGAAAKCAVDNCLRAVREAVPSLQEEDCKSFVRVTVTRAISTLSSTVIITTTGTITKATSIPEYASPCASSAAYESACSCLGITPATTTVPAPSTTHVVLIVETATATAIHNVTRYANSSSSWHGNSTGAKFGNATALFLNVTSSSTSLPVTTSSFIPTHSTASTDKHRLKRPAVTGDASSSKTGVDTTSIAAPAAANSLAAINSITGLNKTANLPAVSNTTANISRHLNSSSTMTRPTAATITGFHSGTADTNGTLRNTAAASAPVLNSTHTAPANATAGLTKLSNATISAPFMNVTSSTPSPTLNTTTPAPLLNSTRIFPFLNVTSSIRFANTTTTSPSPTSTSTSTSTSTPSQTPLCSNSSTTTPFNIRVSQPGSIFNGWYLQISGAGVLFNPSSSRASRFSFSSDSNSNSNSNSSSSNHQQHLCSTPSSSSSSETDTPTTSTADNATVIAIAEARPGVSGSAVYFVQPHVLADMENDQQGWYAPLQCNTSSGGSGTNSTSAVNGTSTLACAQGAKEYWVGCGLGLDITSDGDGAAVVDGWNCTGVALRIEYVGS
ncbi:hypothetical protein F4814DRAFT_121778 [Daldinia grandis]|nr:hypothetical protein F4814DRAFT_121778 [Daldinia grandis]